jgi:uncharacterized protein (DUF924 family)
MPRHGDQAAEVLEFGFVQSRPRQWFAKDPDFDALVRERLDQFPRQIWRDTAMAFAGDPQALPLFRRFSDPRTVDFARRNTLLGRVSSAEELAFLQKPASSLRGRPRSPARCQRAAARCPIWAVWPGSGPHQTPWRVADVQLARRFPPD